MRLGSHGLLSCLSGLEHPAALVSPSLHRPSLPLSSSSTGQWILNIPHLTPVSIYFALHLLLTIRSLSLDLVPSSRSLSDREQYQPWKTDPDCPPSWRLSVSSSVASPAWLRLSRRWNGGWTKMKVAA